MRVIKFLVMKLDRSGVSMLLVFASTKNVTEKKWSLLKFCEHVQKYLLQTNIGMSNVVLPRSASKILPVVTYRTILVTSKRLITNLEETSIFFKTLIWYVKSNDYFIILVSFCLFTCSFFCHIFKLQSG